MVAILYVAENVTGVAQILSRESLVFFIHTPYLKRIVKLHNKTNRRYLNFNDV